MAIENSEESKTCPRCAESIKIKALVCRFCGFEYAGAEALKPPMRVAEAIPSNPAFQLGSFPSVPKSSKSNKEGWGCAAVVILILLILFIGQCSSSKTTEDSDISRSETVSAAALPPAIVGKDLESAAKTEKDAIQRSIELSTEPETPLYVTSWSWGEEYDYAIAEGTVKNQTAHKIENLVAVITFEDRSGNMIKSDDALVDFRPLLPGQTTTFKVMTSFNPAMKIANLRFRTFGGEEIASTQKRSSKKDRSNDRQRKLVSLIQGDLNYLDYYDGKVDGDVGKSTSDAIKSFQKKYQLPVTGRPTIELAAAVRTATLHQPIKPKS